MGWESDPNHSRASFSAKHLGLVTVRGYFHEMSVALQMDGSDPTTWSVQVEIDAASLDTGVHIRDRKLRGPEYLDAEEFPKIVFTSSGTEKTSDDGDYLLHGQLTMHGVTRQVHLRARYNGEVVDTRGRSCRGFSARTAVLRSDFGIHTSESAGDDESASDEVRVAIEIKAVFHRPGEDDVHMRPTVVPSL